jgi:hypothetical protein
LRKLPAKGVDVVVVETSPSVKASVEGRTSRPFELH